MSNSENHENRKHWELGGSTCDRWSNCTASTALIRTVPKPVTSPSAKEGQEAHELAQVCVEDFLDHKLNGTDPEVRFALTYVNAPQEMIDAVTSYRTVVWEKVLEHSVTKKAFGVEDEFLYDENLQIGGTIDFWCAYINDKGQLTICVVDFKYGYQLVEAKKNNQLLLYLLMVEKLLRDSGKTPEAARVCIYQPRCQGEAFKEVKVSIKQLRAFESKILKAARTIYGTPEKTRYKVGSWCKWCPAQAVCPMYSKKLQENSKLSLIRADRELPKPERLSDEALSSILLHRDDIRDFLDAAEAYGVVRFLEGAPVPGTKVVEAKGRRGWGDDIEMIGDELKKHGVSHPYDKKLKTISQMEKLVPKEVIEKLTKISEPRKVLVGLDDERPAIKDYVKMLETK